MLPAALPDRTDRGIRVIAGIGRCKSKAESPPMTATEEADV